VGKMTQKDKILLSAIKDFLKVDDIKIEELIIRCKCIKVPEMIKETWFVDDVPVIEFYNVGEDGKQPYRRLF
jgi:hypothetical protein